MLTLEVSINLFTCGEVWQKAPDFNALTVWHSLPAPGKAFKNQNCRITALIGKRLGENSHWLKKQDKAGYYKHRNILQKTKAAFKWGRLWLGSSSWDLSWLAVLVKEALARDQQDRQSSFFRSGDFCLQLLGYLKAGKGLIHQQF